MPLMLRDGIMDIAAGTDWAAANYIGDVLGHRSSASTAPYLKLATEELRDVALEIPLCAEEDRP